MPWHARGPDLQHQHMSAKKRLCFTYSPKLGEYSPGQVPPPPRIELSRGLGQGKNSRARSCRGPAGPRLSEGCPKAPAGCSLGLWGSLQEAGACRTSQPRYGSPWLGCWGPQTAWEGGVRAAGVWGSMDPRLEVLGGRPGGRNTQPANQPGPGRPSGPTCVGMSGKMGYVSAGANPASF